MNRRIRVPMHQNLTILRFQALGLLPRMDIRYRLCLMTEDEGGGNQFCADIFEMDGARNIMDLFNANRKDWQDKGQFIYLCSLGIA